MHPTFATDDDAIRRFWHWFASVASSVSADNVPVLSELGYRVMAFGISWEIGPGVHAEHALVITPDGNLDKLAFTNHFVSFAPRIAGWEFHGAKPPKKFYLQFSIGDLTERHVRVDAREWRYVLYRFPDGVFDIVVEQRGSHDLPYEDRYTAAVIVVDGILGEERRMRYTNVIEPVAVLSDDLAAKASPIEVLAKHLGLRDTETDGDEPRAH